MRTLPVDPSLLLAADGAPGVAALLSALGFIADWVPIPRAHYRDFGLDPEDDAIHALHQVARHRELSVLLLEVEDPGDREKARRIAARLQRHNRGWRRLLIFSDAGYERWLFASWGLGDEAAGLRLASFRRTDPGRAELDLLAELAPGSSGSATELACRQAQALDKERITRGFYHMIRGAREVLARSWSGIAPGARSERLELALLVLGRLLFLTFLQQKGWLDGDRHYLRNLYDRVTAGGGRFYRDALTPLFFGALNTRTAARTISARRLGNLPFLNGGLFQRYPIEQRYPRLDAPNDAFADLLLHAFERYRFTVQEDTPLERDAAVDPEMLGRVFEGLMKPATRAASGTFYTPVRLVTRLVNGALAAYLHRAADLDTESAAHLVTNADASGLDAATRARVLRGLRRVRILDPAAGSGAFLLVALQKIEVLTVALGHPVADRHALRREIVHHNLYGVDKNGSAVRLCELRLWLALVVDLEVAEIAAVPALPNLDHKVRQGDALLDPVDLWASWMAAPSASLNLWAESRRGLETIEGVKSRYLSASGAHKERWSRRLRSQERRWARRVLDRLETRAATEIREWLALGRGRDLFGRRVRLDAVQRAALRRVQRARRELRALARRLADEGELPFFSWTVHFAEVQARGGFDIVLGNPPWVRPHHVAPQVRETLRARYRVIRDAPWSPGVEHSGAGRGFGAQVDLAAAFVERGFEILKPGGVLAFLCPAKITNALYAGGLRRLLVNASTLLLLEDYSRHGRLFNATTYPLALVCRKETAPRTHRVSITVRKSTRSGWTAQLAQARLPLWPDDPAAPWCLVPAAVREAIDRIVQAGPPLARAGFAPARGIVTGANDIFCPASAHDLEGIEASVVRPLLRGEDVRAWRASPSRQIVFPHDPRSGRPLPRLPPGLARYLSAHEPTLRRRTDLRPGTPYWALFRVTPAKLGPCVAWRDLGRRLEAVALPGLPDGPVPLNTVYLIPTPDPTEADALSALLNAGIVSSFLTTFAERAAAGFFRFFAWTLGCLPLPGRWRPMDSRVRRLAEIGAAARQTGALDAASSEALQEVVAELYALRPHEVAALRGLDEVPATDESK